MQFVKELSLKILKQESDFADSTFSRNLFSGDSNKTDLSQLPEKLALQFWEDVIGSKDCVRWDHFEDSFMALILNKIDVDSPKFDNFSFLHLKKILFEGLGSWLLEDTLPLHPHSKTEYTTQCKKVTRSNWVKFVQSGDFEKSFVKTEAVFLS